VRFIGHLDLVRVWERAARRARLPLAFTQGYAPRPRMHFGPALPTCFESTAEYLDIDLANPMDPQTAAAALTEVLPEGIDVVAAVELEDNGSLQALITTLEYVVALDPAVDPGAVDASVAAVLAADSIPFEIERKGERKTVDLRTGIIELVVVADPSSLPRVDLVPPALFEAGTCLWMRLGAQPRSTRPTEVLSAMQAPETQSLQPQLVHRSAQCCGAGGHLFEPLTARGDKPRALPEHQETAHGTLRP